MVLPTPPGIVKETTPIQQQQQQPLTIEEEPETTPEPKECREGETFNEQTGQCEPETTQQQAEQEQESEDQD